MFLADGIEQRRNLFGNGVINLPGDAHTPVAGDHLGGLLDGFGAVLQFERGGTGWNWVATVGSRAAACANYRRAGFAKHAGDAASCATRRSGDDSEFTA